MADVTRGRAPVAGDAATGLRLRVATEADLPAILGIVTAARALMAADGTPQWQNGKPDDATFAEDVRRGWSRVLVDEAGAVLATAALTDEPDPNYATLLAGAWLPAPGASPRALRHGPATPDGPAAPYLTVHRLAVAPAARGRGASRALWAALLDEARARGAREVRVDTHRANRRMRRLVEGLGFACAGVVCIDGDRSDQRLVYQLFLSGPGGEGRGGRDARAHVATRGALPGAPAPGDDPAAPVLRQRLRVPMADGAELAVWVWGPRVPAEPGPYGIDRATLPLLALHGNGETHAVLAAQIAHQAAARPVVALDARGHGASTRGTAPLAYELLARDAFEVLSALGVTRAHLLGFSDGGIEALLMARDAPGRVASLTVVGANLAPEGLEAAYLRAERRCSLALGFGRVASARLERAHELSRLMLREPHVDPASLARATCPAAVVAGERDLVTPAETRRIAHALPAAELTVVPGCGHMVPTEAPEALCRALDAVIARAERGMGHVRAERGAAPGAAGAQRPAADGRAAAVRLPAPAVPAMPRGLAAAPLGPGHLAAVLALYDAMLAAERVRLDARLAAARPDDAHPLSSGDSCGWLAGLWPLPGDVEERLAAGQYRGVFDAADVGSDGAPRPGARPLGVQALDHDMGHGFGGEDGAAPVWDALPPERVVVPHLLAADPAAAGRGVGCALVADLVAQARAAGAWAVRLNTSPENVPATELYRRCGFAALAPVWLPYEGLPLTGWTVPFELRLR